MHFLPDIYVTCDVCKGKRYDRETLEIKFKGKSIADVLDMTVEEAAELFKAVPSVRDKLLTLARVGFEVFFSPHSDLISKIFFGTLEFFL
jgi:excinuclease ABC subunit A